MNLIEAISNIARQQPDAPAIGMHNATLNYARLDSALATLHALFAAEGIARGDNVAVQLPTSPQHLLCILALARMGATSVSMAPDLPTASRHQLAQQFRVSRVICDEKDPGVAGIPRLVIPTGWQKKSAEKPAPPAKLRAESPWRISLSSGTTGTRKGVLYRHGETLDYMRDVAGVTPGGVGPGTRLLCFGGLDSSFGMRPCLRHLLHGGTVYFTRSRNVEEIVRALGDHKITHAMMSPSQLRNVCQMFDGGRPRFPDIVHLAIGGDVLAPELLQRAQDRVTPNVYSHYGSNETGLVAVASPDQMRENPGSAGRIIAWIEAQAVDGKDRSVAPGEQGALRFRGPGVARAFYPEAKAGDTAFRKGWFYSGDTGSIGKDGFLHVAGRTDDRINLDGVKLDPGEIERILESHDAVEQAAVFPVKLRSGANRLAAALVVRGKLPVADLKEALKDRLRGSRMPALFYNVRELPRNPNGKLLRNELPALAARRAAPVPQPDKSLH